MLLRANEEIGWTLDELLRRDIRAEGAGLPCTPSCMYIGTYKYEVLYQPVRHVRRKGRRSTGEIL